MHAECLFGGSAHIHYLFLGYSFIYMCRLKYMYFCISMHLYAYPTYVYTYRHIITHIYTLYYIKIPHKFGHIVPKICIWEHSIGTRVDFLQSVRLQVTYASSRNSFLNTSTMCTPLLTEAYVSRSIYQIQAMITNMWQGNGNWKYWTFSFQ